MRGFQFYTSRSLAKAVGDGRSVKVKIAIVTVAHFFVRFLGRRVCHHIIIGIFHERLCYRRS